LIVIAVILALLGKNPLGAAVELLRGALGDSNSRADVVMFALPILLCATGLLITFTAGLWNIGIEGQVTMGAIFATLVARTVTSDTSPWLALPAELSLALIGGALWGLLPALLKVYGNVNEIFGGVALNFVAQNVLISLLNGPWKVGTYSSTAPFEAPALLPSLPGTRLSVLAIVLSLAAYAFVFVIVRGTHWGLQLKAMGRNEKSALLLGVRTKRNIMLAMVACGALGGLVGAIQALFVRGRLIPDISGGVGFLGILLALLVDLRAAWLPVVALLLALVPVGGLKLSMALDDSLQLDTSLGNVFQSALVLAVLLGNGVRARIRSRSPGVVIASDETAEPAALMAAPPTPESAKEI
jgi:simple sugar transport system permease protein